jgi:hypothetical protein
VTLPPNRSGHREAGGSLAVDAPPEYGPQAHITEKLSKRLSLPRIASAREAETITCAESSQRFRESNLLAAAKIVTTVFRDREYKKKSPGCLGADCDRALDLPPPSMCDSAAAARSNVDTAPLQRPCREGAQRRLIQPRSCQQIGLERDRPSRYTDRPNAKRKHFPGFLLCNRPDIGDRISIIWIVQI